MSDAEFDDDVTVDVDEALLAQIRAEAARRAGGSGGDDVSDEGSSDAGQVPDSADEATQGVEEELLESIRAGDYEEDVPAVEGYGALREIGRGGFSRVYEALQFEFQRWVAIKVLNERLESHEEIAEFERECRLTGVLSRHPNIVTVLASAFTSEHRPCIVMELFPHGSYLNILQRMGPLSLEELLPLAVRISGALATAHRQGMVHGDVKPQNIFRSEFGDTALGDFGIATLMHQRMEGSKTRLSLYYAAPELIESGISATSPFADQYSLAATIYTLATGLRPFQAETGDTTEQLLSRMLSEPPPRLGGEFPASLDDALWQAMAREPQDRHRDVVAFAAAIANVEHELGFKTTEIPTTRDVGRYVGQTPGLDRPRSTTGSRSQDSPTTPPGTGDTPPTAASREQVTGVVSQTVVRPLTPSDTASPAPEPEQSQERPRIPLWAKIGSAVAAVVAVVAVILLAVTGGNGEASSAIDEESEDTEGGGAAEVQAGGSSGDKDDSGVDDSEPLDDGGDAHSLAPVIIVSPITSTTTEPASTTTSTTTGTVPTVPEAPGDFVVSAHYRRLVVSWDEPNDGGSGLLGYRVDLYSDGEWVDVHPREGVLPVSSASNSAEFPGLMSGKTYEVRLIAVDEVGESEPAVEFGVPLDRVAFVSDLDGRENAIYYADFSTENFVIQDGYWDRATDSDREEGSPSVSPDGSWIAFNRRTAKGGHWQIFVRNIDSGVERQLMCQSDNGWSPTWSPDGRSIAFARGSGGNDIWTINVETGEAKSLKDKYDRDDAYPSWSSDGDTIAFARRKYDPRISRAYNSRNPREIRILTGVSYTTTGTGVALLTKGYEEGDYTSPDWSPDGDRIAYSVSLTGSEYRHIDVMDWDGNKLQQLTREHYDDDPSWSSDGRWVAFARGREGSRGIYVVSSTGGEPKEVLKLQGLDYWDPSWSPSADVSVNPTFGCG